MVFVGDGDGGNEEPVEKEEKPVGNEEGSEDRKEDHVLMREVAARSQQR